MWLPRLPGISNETDLCFKMMETTKKGRGYRSLHTWWPAAQEIAKPNVSLRSWSPGFSLLFLSLKLFCFPCLLMISLWSLFLSDSNFDGMIIGNCLVSDIILGNEGVGILIYLIASFPGVTKLYLLLYGRPKISRYGPRGTFASIIS